MQRDEQQQVGNPQYPYAAAAGESSPTERTGEGGMTARCSWRSLLAAMACLLAGTAQAHEFWMLPNSFDPAAGATVRLQLFVGEHFDGTRAGFSTSHAANMRHYVKGRSADLTNRLPANSALGEFPLRVGGAGTQLIAYDSHPTLIELSGDKFHAYLHEEGLDAVIRQREAQGAEGKVGRERYRRYIKTLLQADNRSDDTYAMRVGHRFELVPLADPQRKAQGERLGFQLLFDGKPLAGTLVKAWHRLEDQTFTIRARSDGEGRVRFALPFTGPWMVGAVHMIAAEDTAEADWDSFWTNLTFSLPAKPAR